MNERCGSSTPIAAASSETETDMLQYGFGVEGGSSIGSGLAAITGCRWRVGGRWREWFGVLRESRGQGRARPMKRARDACDEYERDSGGKRM